MTNPGRAIAITAAGALIAVSALFSAVPAAAEPAPPPPDTTMDLAFCVLPDGAYRLDYLTSGWPESPEYEMHFALGDQRPDPVPVNAGGSIVTTLTESDWDDATRLVWFELAGGTHGMTGRSYISADLPTQACPDSDESVVPDRGIGVDTGITGSARTAQPAPDLGAVAGLLLGAAGFSAGVLLLWRRLSRDGLRRR